jgi:hypothetical protein
VTGEEGFGDGVAVDAVFVPLEAVLQIRDEHGTWTASAATDRRPEHPSPRWTSG